jgi:hypothetical protein
MVTAMTLVGYGGRASARSGANSNRQAFKGQTLTVLMHQGHTINAVEKYVGDFEKATGAT